MRKTSIIDKPISALQKAHQGRQYKPRVILQTLLEDFLLRKNPSTVVGMFKKLVNVQSPVLAVIAKVKSLASSLATELKENIGDEKASILHCLHELEKLENVDVKVIISVFLAVNPSFIKEFKLTDELLNLPRKNIVDGDNKLLINVFKNTVFISDNLFNIDRKTLKKLYRLFFISLTEDHESLVNYLYNEITKEEYIHRTKESMEFISAISDFLDPEFHIKRLIYRCEALDTALYSDLYDQDKSVRNLIAKGYVIQVFSQFVYQVDPKIQDEMLVKFNHEYHSLLTDLVFLSPLPAQYSHLTVTMSKMDNTRANKVKHEMKSIISAVFHSQPDDKKLDFLLKHLQVPIDVKDFVFKNYGDLQYRYALYPHNNNNQIEPMRVIHQNSLVILNITLNAIQELAPSLKPSFRNALILRLRQIESDDSETVTLRNQAINALIGPLVDSKIMDSLTDDLVNKEVADLKYFHINAERFQHMLNKGNEENIKKLAVFILNKANSAPHSLKIVCYQLLGEINPYVLTSSEDGIEKLMQDNLAPKERGYHYYNLMAKWGAFLTLNQPKLLQMLAAKEPNSLIQVDRLLLKAMPDGNDRDKLIRTLIENLLLGFKTHDFQPKLVKIIMNLSLHLSSDDPFYLENVIDLLRYMSEVEFDNFSVFSSPESEYKQLVSKISTSNNPNQDQLLKLMRVFQSYSVTDFKKWFVITTKLFYESFNLEGVELKASFKEKVAVIILERIKTCTFDDPVPIGVLIHKWCLLKNDIPDIIIDRIIKHLDKIVATFKEYKNLLNDSFMSKDTSQKNKISGLKDEVSRLISTLILHSEKGFSTKLKPYQACYLIDYLSMILQNDLHGRLDNMNLALYRSNILAKFAPSSLVDQDAQAILTGQELRFPTSVASIITEYTGTTLKM